MRFRHEVWVTYVFVFLLLGGALIALFFIGGNMTGFAVYQQGSQGDFDEGTYSNTEWNGSSVVLSGSNLSGSYTSKIFDAGADSTWNNLTYSGATPNVEFLFGVDGGGDVFKSLDTAQTWVQTVDKYGRTSATEEMFADDNYLYILSSKGNEVWRSSDSSGTSFSVINNSFTTKSPLVAATGPNKELYVVVGDGSVYKSIDYGLNWILKGDINPGTQTPKGITVLQNGNLYSVDGTGTVYESTNDAVTWTEVNSGYGGSSGTDALKSDSDGNLYILYNTEIYKSIDNGVTWNVINDSISPYANTLVELGIDSSDYFYILDAVGRVFKSTNSGVTWSEVGDMNAGASNNPYGFTNFIQSTNLSFEVRNCSTSDCSDGIWQSVDLNNLNLQSQYFQYRINFTSPDSSATSLIESVSLDYDLVNTMPSLSLSLPQDGDSYGYNESIALNFIVSDADGNLDACWYNIGGNNFTIAGCANTTFDVSGSGDYTLEIYANDSLGLVNNDSISFSVALGVPSISLSYPVDIYLNSGENVEFRYTPEDIDLDSCQLLGNFTGSWTVNQTDYSPMSGSENSFVLNLSDEFYKWNVWCNDTTGNSAFNGNKTFTIDTINPLVSISQPTGTKTSRTNIPLVFDTDDSNIDTCWYNVERGGTIEISNTLTSCFGSTTFDVTVDADFVLSLFVNDSAGNENSTNSSFSIDTSTTPVINSGGGASSGENSGGGFIIPTKPSLNLEDISDVTLTSGGVKKIFSLTTKNNGSGFLNNCKFSSSGENKDWILYTETKGLAAGESYEFVFDVNVPENVSVGSYLMIVSLVCKEINKSASFNIDVLGKQLNFELLNVERIDKENVSVSYKVSELVGKNQSVELQFLIFGLDNKKEAEVNEIKLVLANSEKQFETIIPVRENLNGELSLLVNLNSESYSSFVQENIVLGNSISGFSIFGGEGAKSGIISVVIVLLFLVFAFFMVKRIRGHHKTIKKKK